MVVLLNNAIDLSFGFGSQNYSADIQARFYHRDERFSVPARFRQDRHTIGSAGNALSPSIGGEGTLKVSRLRVVICSQFVGDDRFGGAVERIFVTFTIRCE